MKVPGVAIGLAWTPVGGTILFIEVSKMNGDGKLLLTGKLGDMMTCPVFIKFPVSNFKFLLVPERDMFLK